MQINLITRYPPMYRALRELTRESLWPDASEFPVSELESALLAPLPLSKKQVSRRRAR